MPDHDFTPIALDAEDIALEHPRHCPCRECDPDGYFDPAELDAGRPGERW